MSKEKQIEDITNELIFTARCGTRIAVAEHLYNKGYRKQEWISVDERLPKEFVSVLGYMTDAEDFPSVRECYMVGRVFFFPALNDVHPVSHWMPLPEAPKMKGGAE